MTVCVLGSVNLDTVLQIEALPLLGQTLTARSVSEHLGGKGANQAVAAARMGSEALFIGAVGTDEAGRRLRDSLAKAGADISNLVDFPGLASGRAYVSLADSGENSIIVSCGANGALRPEHLPQAAQSARVLLSQLETPLTTTACFFSGARAAEAIRILNAAPALPEARHLFDLLDILVINETELMTYAGLKSADEAVAVMQEAANSLISRADQAVIVTLGPVGAAIIRPGGVQLIAGRAVHAVDTTGAGDCFCGTLAAELDRGGNLDKAVYIANVAAALSVTRLGAATSAPSRAEVDAFLGST